MKRTILTLLLAAAIVWIAGCQEEQKISPQHPTTIGQMQQIGEWSKVLDKRLKAGENNLLYLYSRTLDPNDPNSLTSRVEKLEDGLEDLEIINDGGTPIKWESSPAEDIELAVTIISDPNEFKYTETNGIPICPYCQKPTERTGGAGSVTLAYYTPIYNKYGNNINPDRNTITSIWYCTGCGNSYTVSGNAYDGYGYIGVDPNEGGVN